MGVNDTRYTVAQTLVEISLFAGTVLNVPDFPQVFFFSDQNILFDGDVADFLYCKKNVVRPKCPLEVWEKKMPI